MLSKFLYISIFCLCDRIPFPKYSFLACLSFHSSKDLRATDVVTSSLLICTMTLWGSLSCEYVIGYWWTAQGVPNKVSGWVGRWPTVSPVKVQLCKCYTAHWLPAWTVMCSVAVSIWWVKGKRGNYLERERGGWRHILWDNMSLLPWPRF